jgi:hypothetical protein
MRELIESAVLDLRGQYAELGVGEGKIPELCAAGKMYTEDMLNAVQREVHFVFLPIVRRCFMSLILEGGDHEACHRELSQHHQSDPATGRVACAAFRGGGAPRGPQQVVSLNDHLFVSLIA